MSEISIEPKLQCRNQFIDFLQDKRNADKAFNFITHWVYYKIPTIDSKRLTEFASRFINELNLPFNMYLHSIFEQLIQDAMIELEINQILQTDNYANIIKYY